MECLEFLIKKTDQQQKSEPQNNEKNLKKKVGRMREREVACQHQSKLTTNFKKQQFPKPQLQTADFVLGLEMI